jgi:hypothetical protein
MYIDQADAGLTMGVVVWEEDRNERVIATLPSAIFNVPQLRSGRMSAKKLANDSTLVDGKRVRVR